MKKFQIKIFLALAITLNVTSAKACIERALFRKECKDFLSGPVIRPYFPVALLPRMQPPIKPSIPLFKPISIREQQIYNYLIEKLLDGPTSLVAGYAVEENTFRKHGLMHPKRMIVTTTTDKPFIISVNPDDIYSDILESIKQKTGWDKPRIKDTPYEKGETIDTAELLVKYLNKRELGLSGQHFTAFFVNEDK